MLKFLVSLVCLSLFWSLSLSKELADPYLWLEQIEEEKALSWVRDSNAKTDESLASTSLYQELYEDALSALNSESKLPEIEQIGDWVYSLKKNDDHPRGLYRRSHITTFRKGKADWITVLDVDELSKQDDTKWVLSGMACLPPDHRRCLVGLSPGGGDAQVLREFDAEKLSFVEGGFELPESKMGVSWRDENHLFVATDFGEGSMTESGYPRFVKLWKRGSNLSDAKLIAETNPKSIIVTARRYGVSEQAIDLLEERVSFWDTQYHYLVNGKPIKLSLPLSARVEGVVDGQLVVFLKNDWTYAGQALKQGSVILVKPEHLVSNTESKILITRLAESRSNEVIESVAVMDESVVLTVLEDVKSKVYRFKKTTTGWLSSDVNLPKSGAISIATTNDDTGEFFVRYEGFITPPTLYLVDPELKVKKVQQQAPTFDSSNLKVDQHFALSKDGTRVPYFVVMSNGIELNAKNPTHIFAYGGFRASLKPSYSGSYEPHNGAYGKAWLERGGVFVSANIRGGAEYGPAWHAAALLENRHKAFEDLEAVAQDLFKRKITTPKHLGIEGRSNGGLLVGATMIRQPDLYGAIICGVPLLDMRRYNKLLAGASWIAEYGNPDTQDWEFMKEYSPYQLVNKEQPYPPIFFFTSTKDDRVHPAHARKMAAKMSSQGHAVEYYENVEGGHKGSATSEQTAKRIALSFTHLWRHLK